MACATTFKGLPTLDVAIARFGFVGNDAKGDHGTFACNGKSPLYRRVKCRQVGHHMVSGHGQQYGVATIDLGLQSGQGKRRGCVAPCGLQHNARTVYSRLQKLACRQKTVFNVADEDGRLGHRDPGQPLQAQCCLLQHGAGACQGQKLLGVGFTRQRPQAGAGAAAQDNGKQWVQ